MYGYTKTITFLSQHINLILHIGSYFVFLNRPYRIFIKILKFNLGHVYFLVQYAMVKRSQKGPIGFYIHNYTTQVNINGDLNSEQIRIKLSVSNVNSLYSKLFIFTNYLIQFVIKYNGLLLNSLKFKLQVFLSESIKSFYSLFKPFEYEIFRLHLLYLAEY